MRKRHPKDNPTRWATSKVICLDSWHVSEPTVYIYIHISLSLSFSLSLFIYLPTYAPIYLAIYLSFYQTECQKGCQIICQIRAADPTERPNRGIKDTGKPWGTSLLPSSCCSANKFKWFPFELGLWCCHSHAAHGWCMNPSWNYRILFHIPLYWLFVCFLLILSVYPCNLDPFWPLPVNNMDVYFGLRVKHSRCQNVCGIHK